MGVRNILILFFSTMAVSLVILIVLFNLVFKNVEMEFDTRIPESAPTLESMEDGNRSDGFKASNVLNSSVQVPDGYSAPRRSTTAEEAGEADERPTDEDDEAKNATEESPATETVREAPKPQPEIAPTPTRTATSETHRPRLPEKPAPAEPEPSNTLFQVYIDGFASEEAARLRVESLKASGVESFVSTAGGRPVVKLGTFSSKDSADAVAAQNGAKVRKVN